MTRSALFLLLPLTLAGLHACVGNSGNDSIPKTGLREINSSQTKTDTEALPAEILFEKQFHDFGVLVDGEKVSFSFKFVNNGKGPLIISHVSSTCGCTVPQYPREPIPPGEQGLIKVSFDSRGRLGMQTKSVTIFSNTDPPSHQLTITSNVVTAQKKQ